MYITVASIKRNLGFKGLEMKDLIIFLSFIFSFLILFCCTSFKMLALSILTIGIFALIPTQISQKNRMYKVLKMVGIYLFSIKEYTYFLNSKNVRGMMLFDTIKNKKRKRKSITN